VQAMRAEQAGDIAEAQRIKLACKPCAPNKLAISPKPSASSAVSHWPVADGNRGHRIL